MQVSADGLLCCTVSNDRAVKIYDVVNYDMMVMMRLPFVAGAVEWVYRQGDVKAKLAISDRNSCFVHIYDAHSGSNEPITSREVSCPYLRFCILEKTWCSPKLMILCFVFSFMPADSHGSSKSYEVQSSV